MTLCMATLLCGLDRHSSVLLVKDVWQCIDCSVSCEPLMPAIVWGSCDWSHNFDTFCCLCQTLYTQALLAATSYKCRLIQVSLVRVYVDLSLFHQQVLGRMSWFFSSIVCLAFAVLLCLWWLLCSYTLHLLSFPPYTGDVALSTSWWIPCRIEFADTAEGGGRHCTLATGVASDGFCGQGRGGSGNTFFTILWSLLSVVTKEDLELCGFVGGG